MADAKTEKQKVQEITEKLEQGIKELFESEKYKTYLNTMSKFHNYSFNNTMLIAMQKPDATLVAGFKAWQKNFDRHVKKGEKGIRILAPAPYKIKEEQEKLDPVTGEIMLDKNGMPITEEVEIKIPAFRVVPVFDVSQTDGTLHVVDYACNTTDQTAENFDLAMLDSGKFYGAGNVVISKKSLLRMQTDSRFRQKVYESIEGLGCTSKMTGGIVKSTGVFIHEDGTGGYWTEFDWGDEEDNGKGKKLLISKKPLNEFFQERSNIGYQLTENDIENIMPLMITGYYKKQE